MSNANPSVWFPSEIANERELVGEFYELLRLVSARPEVFCVEVGRPITEEERRTGRKLVLRVHSTSPLPTGPSDVPQPILAPTVPTTWVRGDYHLHGRSGRSRRALLRVPTNERFRQVDRIQPGLGIFSDAPQNSPGTLGLLLQRDCPDTVVDCPVFALSSWHVLGSPAPKGAEVKVSQGSKRSGAKQIGVLTTDSRVTRDGDFALMRLTIDPSLLSREQLEADAVTDIGDPALDLTLTKSGAGSWVTAGKICGFGVFMYRNFAYGEVIPVNTFRVLSTTKYPPGEPGDSGAVWYHKSASSNVTGVGLNFAGIRESPTERASAFASPLRPILGTLRARLY